jgi:hypothetical protein
MLTAARSRPFRTTMRNTSDRVAPRANRMPTSPDTAGTGAECHIHLVTDRRVTWVDLLHVCGPNTPRNRVGRASRTRPPTPPYVLVVYGGFLGCGNETSSPRPGLVECRERLLPHDDEFPVPPAPRPPVVPKAVLLRDVHRVLPSAPCIRRFGPSPGSATMASADFSAPVPRDCSNGSPVCADQSRDLLR